MAGKEVEIAGQYVNVDRATGKELERKQHRTLMEQADAASTETTAAYQVRQRTNNAYDLADNVRSNAVMLSNQITHSARGNPGLEANLRTHLEEPVLLGSAFLIVRYLNRQ
jgi:hypothetical protein